MSLEAISEPPSIWQQLTMLVLLIVGTLVGAAIFAPPIFLFLDGAFDPLPWPFSRVFNRVTMLMVVVLILLFRKQFRLRHYLSDLRKFFSTGSWITVLVGIVLSCGASLLLLPLIVSQGMLVWSDATVGQISWKFTRAIPAGLLIAVIEEVFFRFFLFIGLRQYLGFLGAAISTSLLYSVVHFIQPVKAWVLGEYHFFIGFEYLSVIFERYLLPGIFEAGIGLFLVGMVLCVTVERSRSILPAIGLHAGWVVATKTIGTLVDRAPSFEYPAGAGSRYFILTQEVSWLSICIVGLLAYLLFREFKPRSV